MGDDVRGEKGFFAASVGKSQVGSKGMDPYTYDSGSFGRIVLRHQGEDDAREYIARASYSHPGIAVQGVFIDHYTLAYGYIDTCMVTLQHDHNLVPFCHFLWFESQSLHLARMRSEDASLGK